MKSRLAILMNWLVLAIQTMIDPMLHSSIEYARDEQLTRGRDDIEARLLIDALAVRLNHTPQESKQLHMKARGISKGIALWFKGNISGANQLAACEGLAEFLPIPETESANCMEQILLGFRNHDKPVCSSHPRFAIPPFTPSRINHQS